MPMFERIVVLGSPAGLRLEVQAGSPLADFRAEVCASWDWPSDRIVFQGPTGALYWDETQELLAGPVLASLRPWPVTVALRLPAPPGSSEAVVGLKLRILLGSSRAWVSSAREVLVQRTGLASSILEILRLPEVSQATLVPPRGLRSEPLVVELRLPADYPASPPTACFDPPLSRRDLRRNGEVPHEALSVFRNWTPANTIFCVLGELLELSFLPEGPACCEEIDAYPPVIPQLQLP
ncbi:unnamed protein product [Polarella glacialis]|uniref:Uncharacterized protein n=1 Tax=Polarella glacialis TaxID=89957 RepID=A0A813DB49_POLGL|nr:unnamed protein product [Polarella glacialis]